jgi:glycosyltransferase involved in cell wall biosynthesis
MEHRHYELGRALVSVGYQVVIISASYSHLFRRQPAISGSYTREQIDGITYWWVRVPRYSKAASIGRVVNMLVFMTRLLRFPMGPLPRPDTIVVSSPSLFPIVPAEIWARRFRAKLVFEVRDVWPLTLQELGGLSNHHPLVALMRWFERRAYRVADSVVSVLPGASSYLVALGVAPDKLAIIPNGVAGEALRAPEPREVDFEASARPFIVGFAGTLGTANALDTLIQAARILKETSIEFVIVGAGSEQERLRDLARDLVSVRFTGAVARSDLPGILKQFDLCYVGYHRSPLYRFGISPNKVFDYMAAARPIVLAADAANNPVAEAKCGRTVAPDDPAALALAIQSFSLMPAGDRLAMGLRGRAFAEQGHSYTKLAEDYELVLGGGR